MYVRSSFRRVGMLISDIATVASVLVVCCIVSTAHGSTMSCRAELNLEAALTPGKADFVIFVDQSYSMGNEAKYVNDNLNAFVNFVTAAGVDARIIMIAGSSRGVRVCIKPPLGRGNFAPGVCTSIPGTTFTPAARSNPPQYVELDHLIGSNDGLFWVVNSYCGYAGRVSCGDCGTVACAGGNMALTRRRAPGTPLQDGSKWSLPGEKTTLRTDAVLNFIAITDDRATYYGRSGGGLGTQQTEAQPFIDTIQELLRADGFAKATPEAPLGFLFHSIVGYTYSDLDSRGHLQNRPELATTPTTCPDVTTYGAPYVELSIKTGGSLHQICQSDWSSIFAKVLPLSPTPWFP